eukprot:169868-Hanusia_phi.AAC.3
MEVCEVLAEAMDLVKVPIDQLYSHEQKQLEENAKQKLEELKSELLYVTRVGNGEVSEIIVPGNRTEIEARPRSTILEELQQHQDVVDMVQELHRRHAEQVGNTKHAFNPLNPYN